MSVDLFPLFDGGSSRTLAKDETLFLTGAPVRSMFLVTEGQVNLIRHTETGQRILLYCADPGSVLAEASAYSDAYHCDGTAGSPAQVRIVPLALFRARMDGNLVLASAWGSTSGTWAARGTDERCDPVHAHCRRTPRGMAGRWQVLAAQGPMAKPRRGLGRHARGAVS